MFFGSEAPEVERETNLQKKKKSPQKLRRCYVTSADVPFDLF